LTFADEAAHRVIDVNFSDEGLVVISELGEDLCLAAEQY